MTAAQKRAKAMILAWVKKRGQAWRYGPPVDVRHVTGYGYVVGRTAPAVVVVVVPWMDAEPPVAHDTRQRPMHSIENCDGALQAGDWCAVGYVVTATSGIPVAVGYPKSSRCTEGPR